MESVLVVVRFKIIAVEEKLNIFTAIKLSSKKQNVFGNKNL